MDQVIQKTNTDNKKVWGKMDDLEFIEFTRTMMEKICQHMADSVEDVDAAQIQTDCSTPVEFAQGIIDGTLAEEILEDYDGYMPQEEWWN